MSNDLRAVFPNLNMQNHRITSQRDPSYNCVAWAVEDSSLWWDHIGGFWPEGVTRDVSLEAYVELFQRLGFELCDSANFEPDFEKIALYEKAGEFTHVARLLDSGNWTSKLGALEDIEHADLESLADGSYGRPVVLLRKPMRRGA